MTPFSSLFRDRLRAAPVATGNLPGKSCKTFHDDICGICPAIRFQYKDEVAVKNATFKEFWSEHRLTGEIRPLIPSPLGRNYRTNSKRRAFIKTGQILLGLTEITEGGKIRPLDVITCPIEPASHTAIYNYIQQYIANREGRSISRVLNHVIIKGTYDELTLILNLKEFSPALQKDINFLSKLLTKEVRSIVSVHVLVDTYSKYYMSDTAGKGKDNFKRIFGEKEIFHKAGGLNFLYSMMAFAQTNGSVMEIMIKTIRDLLDPKSDDVLYDLFTGYGLFGLSMAKSVESMIGVEISEAGIQSAIANAKRNGITNAHFQKQPVTASAIRKWPAPLRPELFILDPPRNGTDKNVIEAIAEREPRRVVHVFCDVDLIPKEIRRWKAVGYDAKIVIPLDMFPATDNLETIVLLEKEQVPLITKGGRRSR